MCRERRETHSHWNLPHCTKHLSPHNTLHSLSLYQLATINLAQTSICASLLWKIFLKWLCPSMYPCVTQLYLHKVAYSRIIREEVYFFSYLLSGSVFVLFYVSRSSAPWERASFVKKKENTKVVWKTCETETEAEVDLGTRTQREHTDSYTCFNNYPALW